MRWSAFADDERGQIVQAHVVLADDVAPDDVTRLRLQNHVKATIAPYKYPRSVSIRAGTAEDADREDPAVPVKIAHPAARPCVSSPRKLDE